MQIKTFNPQIFLEFLCYSVFGGLLLYLVKSGKYLTYVTPRMKPYFYFTVIVMIIWALTGLGRLFRPQHKIRSTHCFVLAIPILLLLLPHNPLSASDRSDNYNGRSTFTGQAGQGSYDTAPADTLNTTVTDTQTDVQEDVPEDENSAALPGLDPAGKKITVSNDDFSMWLTEIYMNMDKYKGYKVILTGYVLKDPEKLEKNEFIPARLMMSCCTADLAPTGLLCKYDKVSELKADSWVTVEGTLFIGQYEYDGEKYDEPQISVTKITPADKVDGYIYPYY